MTSERAGTRVGLAGLVLPESAPEVMGCRSSLSHAGGTRDWLLSLSRERHRKVLEMTGVAVFEYRQRDHKDRRATTQQSRKRCSDTIVSTNLYQVVAQRRGISRIKPRYGDGCLASSGSMQY